MLSICLYLHVHQPYRLKHYKVFDVGGDHHYFNDTSQTDVNNRRIVEKVAAKSYLPTNRILKKLLEQHPEFKVSLSISGTALEQFKAFAPEVLQSFQDLVRTGRVDLIADTYHHSLAFFYSRKEFEEQVKAHHKLLEDLFDYTPRVFRNTELSYTNDLAVWAEQAGYVGILAEGWDPVLGWRSPNYLYRAPKTKNIALLLKNYRLSDDIAFRFSEQSWAEWPLTVEKYSQWVHSHHGDGETINLFMDYETFGEHQWEESGIFTFLSKLPGELLKHPDISFRTVTETATELNPVGTLDVPHVITWADTERDLTAWTGNDIQKAAIAAIYNIEEDIKKSGDQTLIEDWRKLQTSDHFYYMCTKWWKDGDVHAYFSPYDSPYDAYVAFMNVLRDVKFRLETISQ